MPAPPAEKKGSLLPILLAAVVGLLVFGGGLALCAILFGLKGFVIAIFFGGGVFTLAVFHYLLWGWWLGKSARREFDAFDADEDRQRRHGREPGE